MREQRCGSSGCCWWLSSPTSSGARRSTRPRPRFAFAASSPVSSVTDRAGRTPVGLRPRSRRPTRPPCPGRESSTPPDLPRPRRRWSPTLRSAPRLVCSPSRRSGSATSSGRVGASQVDEGPGHYPGTPLPGELGNVGSPDIAPPTPTSTTSTCCTMATASTSAPSRVWWSAAGPSSPPGSFCASSISASPSPRASDRLVIWRPRQAGRSGEGVHLVGAVGEQQAVPH